MARRRPIEAAGLDFGIAPLPKGPAGAATSVNPTGAVVSKGTKSPDAAWAFVKYLASPPAQEQIMALKASLPANKAVLAGPFASSYPGADVLAAALGYAHLKPSFKGYNEFTHGPPGRARRATSSARPMRPPPRRSPRSRTS